MIAIKRLQSIMWILIVAVGALSAYLISLRVGAERNAVASLERQIYATRANIRYLEVEFSARSTMRQLAAWNARDIKYSVPAAGQYLTSEQQLAVLDAIEPKEAPYAAPPVMSAMAEAEASPAATASPAAATAAVAEAAPAKAVPIKAQARSRRDADADFALVQKVVAAAPAKARPATLVVETPKAEAAPRIVRLMDKVDPAKSRATRLALLDETLLGAKPVRPDKAQSGKAQSGKAETGKAQR